MPAERPEASFDLDDGAEGQSGAFCKELLSFCEIISCNRYLSFDCEILFQDYNREDFNPFYL